MAEKQQWELVNEMGNTVTDRMPVPGGWLYRTIVFTDNANPELGDRGSAALAFVPDTRVGVIG